jgi:hypothetical protein
MSFIKEHRFLCVTACVILVLFIIFMIMFYKMFFSYGNNNYGDRLKNIKNLEITNYTITKLESELKELDKVDSVTYKLNGKLINIIFKVDASLDKDDAKEYGDKVLEYFSDEEKNNYDIQIYMIATTSEDSEYPIIGYKKAKKDGITWSNN